MRTIFFTLCLAAALALAPGVWAGGDLPPADGPALWQYLSQANPYQKWSHWPGAGGKIPGNTPHGKIVQIFVNGPALAAIKAGKSSMPSGAMVLKENYTGDGKTLVAITPMYKVKGYNPGGGDWFWVKYGPEGKTLAQGKLKGCINCHRAVADQGWIFTK